MHSQQDLVCKWQHNIADGDRHTHTIIVAGEGVDAAVVEGPADGVLLL